MAKWEKKHRKICKKWKIFINQESRVILYFAHKHSYRFELKKERKIVFC